MKTSEFLAISGGSLLLNTLAGIVSLTSWECANR
jgi:hypothetical protein